MLKDMSKLVALKAKWQTQAAREAIEAQRMATGACPMCGAYNEQRAQDALSGHYGQAIICWSCVQQHNEWQRQGVGQDEIQRRLRR